MIELKEKLLQEYRNTLVNINENDIKLMELGFIADDNCNTMIFSVLIHCMENLDIFNDEQLNNITLFINKLNYGQ